MKEQPLVSIIIPTYNRAHLIGETLDSVIDQTYQDWECIVVDDGSTDHTDELMKTYCEKDPRIRFHHRPTEHLSGGNGARNYGFKMSKGRFIKWFDSDDLMDIELIQSQLDILKLNDRKISLCLFTRYDSSLRTIEVENSSFPSIANAYQSFLKQELLANLPTLLFDRSIVNKFRFNEKILKSQEYDFIQRIFKIYNKEVCLLKKNLVKVRRHQESITSEFDLRKIVSSLIVRLEAYGNLPNDTPKDVKIYISKNYFLILGKLLLHKEKLFFRYVEKAKVFDFENKSHNILKFHFLYFCNLFLNKGYDRYKKIVNKIK